MPGQASIQDLPAGLLERCWAQLGLLERHRTIPFVCRSWWQQLNDSPQLLQDVALKFVGAQAPVRFRSFCERVLRRGAGGMRRLKLNLDLENAYSELAAQEMGATLALLLGACGAAGSLEELRLKEAVGASTCWLAAMRRLRQLHIEVCYSVDVDEIWLTFDSPSWCLAGLEELSLDADRVKLAPTAHLPCTLTRLYISGLEGGELPIQVATATQLRSLALDRVSLAGSAYAPLGGFTGLRHLALGNMAELPACLPLLTSLETLVLADENGRLWINEQQDTAILQAALTALANSLTFLTLPGWVVGPIVSAAAVTGCLKLQTLIMLPETELDMLAPGPALAGLRSLVGPVGLLVRSLSVLGAATQLDFVGAVCSCQADMPALHKLLRWAVQHPTLRRLALAGPEARLNSQFHRIRDAQRNKPNLTITRHHHEYDYCAQMLSECGFNLL